ncbi:MAG: methyltransferase domain-containing protein [Verrucomicrobiia bacterium]
MLHKLRVLKALKGNAIRQTRILLGCKSRPKAPVLSQPVDRVVERHAGICRRLIDLWPAGLSLEGASACEIGPGDCLAAAAFFVAKGARHVDLVELEPPAVNAKQWQVLSALKDLGLPVSLDVISGGPVPALNSQLVSYHKQPMENYAASDKHAFVFSHCVMEHVEDLETVFRAAFRALRPGGRMLHIIDLGGHGEFEDPVPPLDFQTYPDWLFEWMYPTHHRNTRRFLEDYRQAAAEAGFGKIEIRPLRIADKSYIESIYNKLRPAAQKQPREDLAVIEFTLSTVK